jgi:peptide/nickel transport system permease protein
MHLLAPFYRFRRDAPLLSFIIYRVAIMAVMLFVLGFAVFGLMALAPGDMVDQLVSQQLLASAGGGSGAAEGGALRADNRATEAQYQQRRTALGLDRPFYVQYLLWLKRVIVHHDLGVSLISRAPVAFLIGSRMANSVILNLVSLVLITGASFALGVWFAGKAGTWVDAAGTFAALALHAIPGILFLILAQLFAAATGFFPVTADPDFPAGEAPGRFILSYGHHVFLPLLVSFLGGIGGTLRMIRGTMLDQLGQPYITALRSRGLGEGRILFAHAFRNTLNPYITGSANLLAGLFSGSLVLEIIFAYPGVGRLMYDAVMQEDINLVLSNLMFISFLVLLGMVISDILLALVDPRIRYGKGEGA